MEKEEGRPYSFAQLVYKFLIYLHLRLYKEHAEPQFSIWKSRQPWEQIFHCRLEIWIQKESTHKKSMYLLPILQNCVYESG
jgi:hypothetical protein